MEELLSYPSASMQVHYENTPTLVKTTSDPLIDLKRDTSTIQKHIKKTAHTQRRQGCIIRDATKSGNIKPDLIATWPSK